MSIQTFTNPDGSLRTVSDFTTMKDDSGEAIQIGSTTRLLKASAAITAGAVVNIVPPTTTEPMRVVTATASSAALNLGIAATSGAAGDLIEVVTEGLAFATVGTNGATAGDAFEVESDGITDLDSGAPLGTILKTGTATAVVPVYVK